MAEDDSFTNSQSQPRRSRKYPDLNELEAELETAREEKLRARKKRKLEAVNAENNVAKKIKLDEKVSSSL